jgi:CheY-like chemotaxis protein
MRKKTMETSPDNALPRILIVDDQSSNVRLLEHTLRRVGYTEVMSTTEPRDVVSMHVRHRYDLILLDLQMPVMDGFAVLEKLQEIRPEHPVAILVISAEPAQTSAAVKAGADSFLAKPFRLPEVAERVQHMLKIAGEPAVQLESARV